MSYGIKNMPHQINLCIQPIKDCSSWSTKKLHDKLSLFQNEGNTVITEAPTRRINMLYMISGEHDKLLCVQKKTEFAKIEISKKSTSQTIIHRPYDRSQSKTILESNMRIQDNTIKKEMVQHGDTYPYKSHQLKIESFILIQVVDFDQQFAVTIMGARKHIATSKTVSQLDYAKIDDPKYGNKEAAMFLHIPHNTMPSDYGKANNR